jgi:hypothetical protein
MMNSNNLQVRVGSASSPKALAPSSQHHSSSHSRSQPNTPSTRTRRLQNLQSAGRPATVPSQQLGTRNPNRLKSEVSPMIQTGACQASTTWKEARDEVYCATEVSQTVVAAARSVLRACPVTPPITNSAFGISQADPKGTAMLEGSTDFPSE